MDLLIFTDLDGTLLDFESYEPGPASEAVEACLKYGVPVIPCTSKTAPEVIELRTLLGLDSPFIVENGAVVYLPAGSPEAEAAGAIASGEGWATDSVGGFVRLILGKGRAELVQALSEIGEKLRLTLRGLSAMTVEEVSERTGLPSSSATAAMKREFSEPFLLLEEGKHPDESARLMYLRSLQDAAAAMGLACLMGGRFFHLLGRHSKGTAAGLTARCYAAPLSGTGAPGTAGSRPPRTMALGDALNDLEMLAAVDYPVLVRRPDGSHAEGIDLPGLVRTDGIGPAGWNKAVMARLKELQGPSD